MTRFLLFLLIPLLIFAQGNSENYTITHSVVASTGETSTSENYALVCTIGQATPPGISTSDSFTLHAGFLHPTFAVSPLSPIQDLVIKEMQPDVFLMWGAIPGAAVYNIYRDTESIFTPTPATLLDTTEDPFYTDVGIIAAGTDRYFYIITSTP